MKPLLSAVVLLAVVFSANYGLAQSVARAVQEAQSTGRPIFAVAGATSCPHCVTLMKRLQGEEKLQPLIAEFVPLKMDVSSRDFQMWKKFFPRKRSAIPALYIVTPAGEALYAKTGSLPTKRLEELMIASLVKAGRLPTEQQWEKIEELTTQAKQLLEDEQLLEAIERLESVLVSVENRGHVLQLTQEGKELDSLLGQIGRHAEKFAEDLGSDSSSASPTEQALNLARAKRVLSRWPTVEKDLKIAERKFTRSKETRTLYQRARELDRATNLLNSGEPKEQAKATALLKRMADRYQDTPQLAELAVAQLEKFRQ